ncbi:MAG: hypothetical protein A3D39_03740 [Candidatus Buchananbacteria bacterium RIFCSPHIGHO2_02_FULL_39_17]|nr:MAG: hypothetical protein A3D39_03740 [Candidatus Buchananbacteria bacterium RIFCSPHIGHO2_02_FULL_39_17]
MEFNFFGKTFQWIFLLIILAELLSLTVYLLPPLNQAAFFIILGITLILALIKLDYGIYIVLTELFIGGHGHLFAIDINGLTISIRIGLFLMILMAWVVKSQISNLKSQNYTSKIKTKSYKLEAKSLIYFLLFITILIGIINGLLNNNPANVFFDTNAWFYFALLPVFLTTLKEKQKIENILQILTGATTYLSLKTIAVLFLFAQNFAGIGGWFYHWIRASGVGEVTYISGTLFRIFFQSQLYVLIGFFIVLTFLINQLKIKDWKKILPPILYLYLTSLVIFISQSRSYWVGAAAALIFLIILGTWRLKIKLKKIALLITAIAVVLISQFYLIEFITGNYAGNLVAQRFKNLPQEAAGISRLNQLKPLSQAIFQKLIFGWGFGKTLTYESRDPRVLQTHPDGIYTTYAFEWGYLDIWLKLGLFGLVAYLTLISYLFYLGIQKSKVKSQNSNSKFKIINVGLLIGLIALVITNIFSPYLNHPLGIGYIILVTAIFNEHKLEF